MEQVELDRQQCDDRQHDEREDGILRATSRVGSNGSEYVPDRQAPPSSLYGLCAGWRLRGCAQKNVKRKVRHTNVELHSCRCAVIAVPRSAPGTPQQPASASNQLWPLLGLEIRRQ